jgi:hypothetical protein
MPVYVQYQVVQHLVLKAVKPVLHHLNYQVVYVLLITAKLTIIKLHLVHPATLVTIFKEVYV